MTLTAPHGIRGGGLDPEDLDLTVIAIYEVAFAGLGATAVGGVAAAALMARSRQTLTRSLARAQAAAADAERQREAVLKHLRQRDEALKHLVGARLPSLALHLRSDHYPVPGLKDTSLSGTEFAALLDAVQRWVSEAVLDERQRVNAAASAALRGAFMEIQAKAYRLQTDLTDLQHSCEDEKTLKDYFRLDHLNEQLVRLVQKGAIVAGLWPGLVRPNSHLPDLVTAATARLAGFERVSVHSKLRTDTVGVVGRAAEPVAVACTELLANALEFSRADLSVEVTLLPTDNGAVCIQIDDAGKGMTAEEDGRAAQLLAGGKQVLLTELGDPPALGFAAVGRLAFEHGFGVTVDQTSPYSGVRAIITIPPALVAEINPRTNPLSAMSPLPAPAPRAPRRAVSSEQDGTAGPDSDALPQRRRHRRRASGPDERTAPVGRPPEPGQARTIWDDFEQGMAAGRSGAPFDTIRNEDRA
ncbi:sensor histidine kinase [Streptomyces sp. NPDC057682]|uniref:ATP-binding protein n=1 Tax=Streptomyces sp. NPDC057682 TaxID=3346210 RepID=UPI003698A9F2